MFLWDFASQFQGIIQIVNSCMGFILMMETHIFMGSVLSSYIFIYFLFNNITILIWAPDDIGTGF